MRTARSALRLTRGVARPCIVLYVVCTALHGPLRTGAAASARAGGQDDSEGGASGPTTGGRLGQHTDSRPIVEHETGCEAVCAGVHGHVQWLQATESGTSGQQPPAPAPNAETSASARANRR